MTSQLSPSEQLVQSFIMGSKHSQSGQRRLELLGKIDALGSLNAAAKACSMSYKGAWQAVDAMNQLAGEELVIKQKGGSGGGGMLLSEKGRALLNAYQLFNEQMQKWLHRLEEMSPEMMGQLELMKKLSMRTSARNLFYGTVTAIEQGAVNAEVLVRVADGLEVRAQITLDSLERLQIVQGSSVFALIKASWVILMNPPQNDGKIQISAGNQFCGEVEQIDQGAVNSEVMIGLSQGQKICAQVSNQSVAELELQVGKASCALVNANQVLLAVAD
ncbi:TOBE domain-containing protein [Thiomicrorhabdus sediminis]|uniref:LysR family transcriptional regulator n=1 Tax=Thiomicrorhabdus sediminis TaxID=2580412 RepID=A0A4P9K7J3_9GAMM|nr:TOBE domain-containing protein [Thiomicrorhabdus sediminis]QCU90908.1 LysR family transcriptional regulator [Thiomicrorhabdus sediminis]